MSYRIDRRGIFKIAAGSCFAVTGAGAAAQPAALRGTVTFEGGAAIPEGRMEIVLEDPAIADAAQRIAATIRVTSGGKAREITFALDPPVDLAPSPTLRIVAYLERPDGWLIARGAAPVQDGAPVRLTLHPTLH